MMSTHSLRSPTLPAGVRSRFVSGINGLTVHLLEAGYAAKDKALRAAAARLP